MQCRTQEQGVGGGEAGAGALTSGMMFYFYPFINCIIYIQFSNWIICNYALIFGAYFSNATLSIKKSYALRVAGYT